MNSRGVWALTQGDLSKKWLDMEQNALRSISEANPMAERDACMMFCDTARPLYLETAVSAVSEPDY